MGSESAASFNVEIYLVATSDQQVKDNLRTYRWQHLNIPFDPARKERPENISSNFSQAAYRSFLFT